MKTMNLPPTPTASFETPVAAQAAEFTRVRRLMWVAIALVFLVVGAYAAFVNPTTRPARHEEILQDPEFHPIPVPPPAPVGPTPPDAALIASAR